MTKAITYSEIGNSYMKLKYLFLFLFVLTILGRVYTQSESNEGDNKEKDNTPSVPNYIDVVIYCSVSKIAYAKIHAGELIKAVKTLNFIGLDNDPNFEAHQGIFLKEVKFTNHTTGLDRSIFSKVLGGYTIPYNYLEDDLDLVDEPLFGYTILSNVHTGKYATSLSITICNSDLDFSVINDLTKIIETLISAHKTFLNNSKENALLNSHEFVNMAKTYQEFKQVKDAVSSLLRTIANLVSEYLGYNDICEKDKTPLELKYETALGKYSRLKQELLDLEEDRRAYLFNLAKYEKIQIEKKSLIESVEIERKECEMELEGIKKSEQIMNKYNGGINWSECYSDGDADCDCILQNSGSGSRRMRR